jgi:hypothetical protein
MYFKEKEMNWKKITKIECSRVPDSILPARVTAFRKDGTVVEAGDRFLNLATMTLFSLLTGKQFQTRDIEKIIRKKHLKVDQEILDVL